MRICSIANLINSFYGGVDGSIKPNGIIRTRKIVVDRSRQTNDGNVESGCMAGVINNKVIFTPIMDAIVQQKELNDDFIKLAKILAI